jgi:hypothetical protein
MRAPALLIGLAGVAAMAAGALAPLAHAQADRPLRAPEDFRLLTDDTQRAQALFKEAGRVIQHPRCLNCHPSDNRPRQGKGEPHHPPVERGEGGHGPAGMPCSTCHQKANFEPGRVPGAPRWELAPLEMGWQGRTLAQICKRLSDRRTNGGRDLHQIAHHMTHDDLVGWAWSPGAGREPAPGTQAAFGALIEAWVKAGAACPD